MADADGRNRKAAVAGRMPVGNPGQHVCCELAVRPVPAEV